ncbi:hypothetical protein [Halobacterium jilantaiense]|uniref:Uncharacterized protein n=1 Tax=Halobacterium jilantaiense TaxID=355548 RepID=A0A1I0P7B2_9EURY|nr:hypothetical protein [Halobacterium jilantaiense]SEW10098.1 hypothetical protein SAMN04487945_1450 [Halobacterium jilantaiense]
MATWPADSISSGFVYVADAAPENPSEGETWYDLGTNEAKVYDGVEWHLLTVTDHSEVGGVSAGQHRSDANVRATVDGQVDAETVDGRHASDLGMSVTEQSGSDSAITSGTENFSRTLFTTGDVMMPFYIRGTVSVETSTSSTSPSADTRVRVYAVYEDGTEDNIWGTGVTGDSSGDGTQDFSVHHQSAEWGLAAKPLSHLRADAVYDSENPNGASISSSHSVQITVGTLG